MMLLLFEPDSPVLRWCVVDHGVTTEHSCPWSSKWFEDVLREIGDLGHVEAVGYMLHHGGQEIRTPVSALTREGLGAIEKTIRFLPEFNDMTLRTANYLLSRLPSPPHYLFCDTAFFANLPREASAYAVPYALLAKGIRRYGGDGLWHQWAGRRAAEFAGSGSLKTVSIVLGDRTSIAAINAEEAVETSIGFTPAEGVLSSRTCGDLDPTVVFQLQGAGMSLEEIHEMLSKNSGFRGVTGKASTLMDILRDSENPDFRLAKDMLRYSIQKYIGGFISVLGGVDVIAFVIQHPDMYLGFVEEICRPLGFLGLRCAPAPRVSSAGLILTSPESRPQCLCFTSNKWSMLVESLEQFTSKEG